MVVEAIFLQPLPAETQSSGQQANNMAIDGTGGVPQVECTKMELTAEGNSIQDKPCTSLLSN